MPARTRRLTTKSTTAPRHARAPRGGAIRLARELAPHVDGAPTEILDTVTGPFERRLTSAHAGLPGRDDRPPGE
jgi:hypothetical protein